MQLTFSGLKHLKPSAIVAGLTVLIMSGCNQASGEAAASGPSTSRTDSSGASFELVLATRPENPELYFKHIKPFHELCAVAAEAMKVPVKPFLVLPANFILERQTKVADRKNRMDKTEGFGLGGGDPLLTPQTGCATELGNSSVTQVTFNGRRQDLTVANDGTSEISPAEALMDIPSRQPPDLRDYSVKKTVLGIAVRCLGATHPVISSKSLLEACIFDGRDGSTLLNEEGKEILVYSRQIAPVGNGGIANTVVTEPIRVSIGKAIDPGLFKLQGGQK